MKPLWILPALETGRILITKGLQVKLIFKEQQHNTPINTAEHGLFITRKKEIK